jgi:hypothetical protein
VLASTPATAAPLDKGHFDDTFTETFDCDTVNPPVPTRHDSTAHINFTFNQRGGPNIFPYYRESVSGTNVYTNLDTGGTYTEIFTSNSRDHNIVDNGDGTITIFSQGSGGERWYDTNGRLVLMNPGNVRFAFDIDYNGTPGNPDDDQEVPDSFRIIRDSTGVNIVDRDFCADLRLFTT